MNTISLLTRKFKETRTKDEYKRIADMLIYIRTFNYNKKINEKVVLDVLTILNDGFENGQTLDEIIGFDDKYFIDEIYMSLNKKPYKIFSPKIIGNIILLIFFEIFFTSIEIYKEIFDFKFLFLRILIYISLLAVTFHYEYIYKHSLYEKEKKKKYKKIDMFLYMFLETCLWLNMYRIFEFKYYMLMYLISLYIPIIFSFKE